MCHKKNGGTLEGAPPKCAPDISIGVGVVGVHHCEAMEMVMWATYLTEEGVEFMRRKTTFFAPADM